MQTAQDRKAEVELKVLNLYSKNIQIVPRNEFAPDKKDGGSATGRVTKEFLNVDAYSTNSQGHSIYKGTKG